MKLAKNKFISRLCDSIGLQKDQARSVYQLIVDERMVPSIEIIKPVEVNKEVPVEVVKKVEVIKEVEVIREVPVEIFKEKVNLKEVIVNRDMPVEVVKEVNVF